MTKRSHKLLVCLLIVTCLSAGTSVLIGNRAQSLLMKAIFKPLVGFDPTEVKLLEKPIIKERMQALLGEKYEPAMKLLNTAQEIQQEGALFYIASHYAPKQVQAITDKAGMVWNGDTNQMAVVLIENGKAEIFSEQIAGAKEKLVPTLPKELQAAYDQAKAAEQKIENLQNNAGDMLLDKATEKVDEQLPVPPSE